MSVSQPTSLEDAEQSREAKAGLSGLRRLWSKLMKLIRRVHLYAGLLLLPWVMLYGVTGAMFNHQGLFPDVSSKPVSQEILLNSPMQKFPTAERFAEMVVNALSATAQDHKITLRNDHGAEFTNEMMFEAFASGQRYLVHIDPVSHAARIVHHPENKEKMVPVLKEVKNVSLDSNPQDLALQSVSQALTAAGITPDKPPQAFGWTKLNFLANVDGQPARVTYVLKDGHVDVTKFTGEDGMSLRHLFLRLHTAHGQPPHKNSRWFWSLFVDAMAIAMVAWGISGILMWWQIKRTRMLGSALILLSLVTATVMYLAMHDFYATTIL